MSRGICGVYAHEDSLLESVRAARDKGFTVREVFSPVPSHHILEVMRPGRSPVRFVTFVGGITGLVAGLALALWTSMEWDLIVGGKPVTSIVPFMVVGFEATILLGAIATLTALVLFSRLPYTRFPGPAFRPEFTKDRFGLWLVASDDRIEEARSLLEEGGALEVHDVDGEGAP
jgi:molybdopterin-containing oxidoreductase family membrane subunit